MQSVMLASVFSDQMNGIEHAPLVQQLIDAGIVFGIAAGLKMAEDRTNLPVLKYLCWGFSGIGAYVLYLALFV
jgi:hypothetical protein